MRYIIHKDGLKFLKGKEKAKETNLYSHLPFATIDLTPVEVKVLKDKKITISPVVTKKVDFLAGDYERNRSAWVKFYHKNITGRGCKVAVLDSGCNTTYVPVDYAQNFITGTSDITDLFGHGTQTTSVIKSSIGIANGCELHHLKCIDDTGGSHGAAMLSAINYCVASSIDIINMSFSYSDVAFDAAIGALAATNCIPVAAAGNNTDIDRDTLTPAKLTGVVAVNGVKEDGTIIHRNILFTPPYHGITIACSGWGCDVITRFGAIIQNHGTSFSSPFFCGIFALYKEMLGITDNKKVLQHILNKALKTEPAQYFGAGIVTA